MMLDDVWCGFGLWSSTGITRKITQWCPLALYFADTEIATITKLFRTGHALPTVFQYQVMQSRRALDLLQEPNVSLLDTTLQRARHGQDASEDRVLSSHCMPLANHVNHDHADIHWDSRALAGATGPNSFSWWHGTSLECTASHQSRFH